MTTTKTALSESMQMYLVSIARLRQDDEPVPLSSLAENLSISPVSVNEMCRKLEDHGLVLYQPYKGASLTEEGERLAHHILRRHRLWEVFLVDRLGFEFEEAHGIACQLEHATPDQLADRLDIYLERPRVNPLGDPIPRQEGQLAARPPIALTALSVGQRGHVVRSQVDEATRDYLQDRGVRPNGWVTLLAMDQDSVMLQVGARPLVLARQMADAILVQRADDTTDARDRHDDNEQQKETRNPMQVKQETNVQSVPLSSLKVGQRGVVVRMGGKGRVRRRMMDMGLVPGTEVTVRRVAPLGDPIEFTVRGYSLSLRKAEAERIQVEIPE